MKLYSHIQCSPLPKQPPLSQVPWSIKGRRESQYQDHPGEHANSFKMINVAGVVSIVLFYVLILAVGIWAGRKKEAGNDSEEEVMLAGRSIGLFVGIFTMTGELWLLVFCIQFPINHHHPLFLPLPISHLGRWRLHQRNRRGDLHHRTGVVPSSLWIRLEFSLWWNILCQSDEKARLHYHVGSPPRLFR